jgi:hypothetical protein
MRVAAALALIVALGHTAVAVLVQKTTLYLFERWSLSFLIGIAAISALWAVCDPFYDVIEPVWLLSILCVIIVVSARSPLRRVDFAPKVPRSGKLEAGLSLLLAVEFTLLLFASLRTPIGWDGLFNFELKARLIFENTPSGRLPLAYLSDMTRNWSHPQYPLMVPFAEFWIYSWLGRIDQTAIKILFPLFYFALIGLLCGAIRRIASRRASLGAAVVIGVLPPFTLLPGAASGYADVPLAAAITGCVSFALLALRTGNSDAWVVAGVLAAIAAWTKSEGALLAGCIGAAAFAAVLWNRRVTGLKSCATATQTCATATELRPMLALVWIPLVALIPWLLIQQRHGIPSIDFVPVTAAAIFENLGRLPAIIGLATRELLRPGHWGLIWPAWGCAALATVARRDAADQAAWFLTAVVSIPLVVYVLVFMLSAWPDPLEHLRWALPRLLVPLAPAALILTILKTHSASHLEPS